MKITKVKIELLFLKVKIYWFVNLNFRNSILKEKEKQNKLNPILIKFNVRITKTWQKYLSFFLGFS